MPAFHFAPSAVLSTNLDSAASARAEVADLFSMNIFHTDPIVDGTPWPELVLGFSPTLNTTVLDLTELDIFHPGPITDGVPALELSQDLNLFG